MPDRFSFLLYMCRIVFPSFSSFNFFFIQEDYHIIKNSGNH